MSDMIENSGQGTAFDASVRYKLAHKAGLFLSALIFVVILVHGLYNYQNNVRLILKNLQIQLQLAANTVAMTIDGDAYQTLKGKESMQSEAYAQVLGTLEEFMVNRYLGFDDNHLYTFRRISEDSLEFTVMLHQQYVGNRYAIRPEMIPTLEEGIPSYTGVYEDENGAWVSAYAPIFNSDAEVVGIVEVDFTNNVYLKRVQRELYSVFYTALIGVVISIVVAYSVGRFISRPVVRISRAAFRLSQGKLPPRVPVSTNDEIGLLIRAFNYMVQEIQDKEFIQTRNEELTLAYKRLDQLNQSLTEANQLKSEFLSIAAHDLKSPLQVIQGYCERIEDTPDLADQTYENARKISHAVRRMLSLISHLLDTTALDSGNLRLKLDDVDVCELTQRVIEDNQHLARQKKQRLDFSGIPECQSQADSGRLYEIVDNLINNAIKFSPRGTPIDVRISRQNHTDNGEASRLCISISDQGPGLSAEDKVNLFRRFHRLSAVPTGGESSTGLGLAITKQLVDLHGGRIWAENNQNGRGTTFHVHI